MGTVLMAFATIRIEMVQILHQREWYHESLQPSSLKLEMTAVFLYFFTITPQNGFENNRIV